MTAVLFRHMELTIWAIFRDFMITSGRVPKVRKGCSRDGSYGALAWATLNMVSFH